MQAENNNQTPFEQRRVKIISIDHNFMVDVLNWWRNPPHWMSLPDIDELPKDSVVVSVNVAWERRCLEAMVASKEFDVVPEGYLPERIPAFVTKMRHVPFVQEQP